MAQRDDKHIRQVKAMMRELQHDADKLRLNDNDGAAVGAVLIQNGHHYYGFNSIGRNGMHECHTHAEIMAIRVANKDVMNDIECSSMITTRAPCEYCAAHIIASGITEVYCPPIRIGSKWRESQEIGRRIMEYVGIKVVEVELEGVRG